MKEDSIDSYDAYRGLLRVQSYGIFIYNAIAQAKYLDCRMPTILIFSHLNNPKNLKILDFAKSSTKRKTKIHTNFTKIHTPPSIFLRLSAATITIKIYEKLMVNSWTFVLTRKSSSLLLEHELSRIFHEFSTNFPLIILLYPPTVLCTEIEKIGENKIIENNIIKIISSKIYNNIFSYFLQFSRFPAKGG